MNLLLLTIPVALLVTACAGTRVSAESAPSRLIITLEAAAPHTRLALSRMLQEELRQPVDVQLRSSGTALVLTRGKARTLCHRLLTLPGIQTCEPDQRMHPH